MFQNEVPIKLFFLSSLASAPVPKGSSLTPLSSDKASLLTTMPLARLPSPSACSSFSSSFRYSCCCTGTIPHHPDPRPGPWASEAKSGLHGQAR